MKTCRVCGAIVEDKNYVCPECGAELVKSSGTLSLKTETEKKSKSGNPMGQSISTGSGLTDILRAGDEEDGVDDRNDFYEGSIPTSMAKTTIEGDYSAKKKKKIFPVVFKFLILIAVAYGIFFLVTKVILKEKEHGAKDAEEAVEILIEGIQNGDVDEVKKVIPPYIKEKKEEAQDILDKCQDIEIVNYRIKKSDTFTSGDLSTLKDEIKLKNNKTIDIDAGKSITITCKYKKGDKLTEVEKKYIYFEVDNEWFYYGEDDRQGNW